MKNFRFLMVVLFFSACVPQEDYPDTPYLEFKSLVFAEGEFGPSFSLKMSFTDGDGDIGYYLDRPNDSIFDDSTSEYYYNFKIILQVYKNGNWVDSTSNEDPITPLYYNVSSRIPYLTPEEKNKALKGDIEQSDITLPFPFYDTLRLKTFIYDRALHKSNEVFTPSYFIDNR